MSLLAILILLFGHWVWDFVLQSDWMARNKSTSWVPLLCHTLTYSVGMAMVWYLMGFSHSFLFWTTTFLAHTITDYCTSRINTYLWKKQNVHLFFVSVGFDQFLHYLQLLITGWLLI